MVVLVQNASSSSLENQIKTLDYTLFKPPKNDTNYFFYTEVETDFMREKR